MTGERLRVGFLVSDYPTVSEAFIANHARALADLDVELTILALARQGPDDVERTPAGRAFTILGGNMPLPSAERWRRAPKIFSRLGFASLALADPLRHGESALSLKALYLAPLLLRAGPLDILHCQFAPLGEAAAAARLAGYSAARIVVHFRGYDITSYVQRHGSKVYRRLFERGDRFLANCHYFEARARAMGCDPRRMSVLRSGIDLMRFQPRPARPFSSDRLLLVSVGRLIEKKGFHDALDALARLRAHGVKARYRLIGEGPLRGKLEARARELGVAAETEFLGAVPNHLLPPLVAEGDVFLAPSDTPSSGDQDGPANTVKEAMALGLPVIVSRHGGLPELVIDRITGLLVPERSPEAIALAVLRLLESPQLVEALRQNARKKVEMEYDVVKINAELLATYHRVLASPSALDAWSSRALPAEPPLPDIG